MTTNSYYGGGDVGDRVWLEDVMCEGGESDIGDCVSGDWRVVTSECASHTQDAGVICAGTLILTLR